MYCPSSEEEWKKASERKKCSAFDSKCSNPKKLAYHCVTNPFLNETVEVCAYDRIIFLGINSDTSFSGYCTEYSLTANRIQQNFQAKCDNFTIQPCPPAYHSSEAFKYLGCYELIRKSRKTLASSFSPSSESTTWTDVMQHSRSTVEHQTDNSGASESRELLEFLSFASSFFLVVITFTLLA
ncbi:uncharacterized protein LOC133200484 [Saccostrea echinata]|uniref:uncharacterized protein LOC133200484 n=1 Tax=Saccostrea echinata TaxID=191078 RepID=UPI002A8148A7|nr:uncharacterized protein LOC133200484 [Saccostrea echinata]